MKPQVAFDYKGIIYGLIHSDTLELRYIGQTIREPERRLVCHRYSSNKHLRRWITKYPVSIIVLERVSLEMLDAAEIRWIALMRAQGARLINLTDGGKGVQGLNNEARINISTKLMGNQNALGHKCSDETRARLSTTSMGNQNMLGHKHSDETRAKISIALTGQSHNLEHRAKISEALKGRIFSAEHRANLSAAYGHVGGLTVEARTKISNALRNKPWSEARRRAQKQRNK